MLKVTSLEQLRSFLSQGDGYTLSTGTLNPEHLLVVYHDVLVQLQDAEVQELVNRIRAEFVTVDSDSTLEEELSAGQQLGNALYYSRIQLREDAEPYDLLESCANLFEQAAPPNMYFGSLEGDGAHIGWFRLPEDSEEAEDSENSSVTSV